jgi:Cytochrome oxidase complex assembly protein 1
VSRLIWIVLAVSVAFAVVFVAAVGLMTVSMLHMLDRTPGHVCAMAAVKRSPVALRLVGTPVEQRGFTGGSSSSENGELTESVRFTVGGPRGTAYVESEGRRSPLDSYLRVRIGRDQRSEVIYSGPFDCPELHAAKP